MHVSCASLCSAVETKAAALRFLYLQTLDKYHNVHCAFSETVSQEKATKSAMERQQMLLCDGHMCTFLIRCSSIFLTAPLHCEEHS